MEDVSGPLAPDLLHAAIDTLAERGRQRVVDDEGERSMDRTVAVFNALTGQSMSVADGWRFMLCLKLAREANRPEPHQDDYIDFAAYAALLGEHQVRV